MGKVEVFELHIADIVGVRNLYIVLILDHLALAGVWVSVDVISGAGFGTVAGFSRYRFGEDILFVEKGLQDAANFVYRPCAAVERSYGGYEDVWVVLDCVKLKVVFVVVVRGFVTVEVVLQLRFHSTVGGFGGEHIRVLTGIGRCGYT